MLTFEEKRAIIESFPQLTRHQVSLGRVNFHYAESLHDKKNVVYHLHPNGNGFVYAGLLRGYRKQADDKGFVNIRDYSADALRSLIEASIHSLSQPPRETATANDDADDFELAERWVSKLDETLTLVREGDLWNVYASESLDAAFESYEEAVNYLREEGFGRR